MTHLSKSTSQTSDAISRITQLSENSENRSNRGTWTPTDSLFRSAAMLHFNLKQLFWLSALVSLILAYALATSRIRHDQIVAAIAFSPDAKALAVQGNFNVQVFEVESGRKLAGMDLAGADQYGYLEFVDNNTLMAHGYGGDPLGRPVWWLDIARKRVIRKEHIGVEAHFHFAPGRRGFLVDDNEKQTRMFFSNGPEDSGPLPGFPAAIPPVASFRHGLPFAYYNGTIDYADPGPQRLAQAIITDPDDESRKIPIGMWSQRAGISNQGDSFFLEEYNRITFHDAKTGDTIWKADLPNCSGSRYLPGDKYIAAVQNISQHERKIHFLDCSDGSTLMAEVLKIETFPFIFDVSSEGQIAISKTGSTRAGIEIHDAKTGKLQLVIGQTNKAPSLRFLNVSFTLLLFAWSCAWSVFSRSPSSLPEQSALSRFITRRRAVSRYFIGISLLLLGLAALAVFSHLSVRLCAEFAFQTNETVAAMAVILPTFLGFGILGSSTGWKFLLKP